MFKNEYQGGGHVEVFSAQGRDPMARWKVSGTVKREYNKEVKGFVCVMEGGSSTTRIQLPKTDKASLGLVQQHCVLQLRVPPHARFAVELSVLDGGGSRRRVQLSTSLRETSVSPLNARVPLTTLCRGEWLNLCLDLPSLVAGLFKGQEFRSLEGVSVGGTCNLRRIFTLRAPPPHMVGEGGEGGGATEAIPKVCQMSVPVQTQVLTSANVAAVGRPPSEPPGGSSPPGSGKVSSSQPTHVAFGSKVAIPHHILHSRAATRGNSGRTRVGSGHSSPQTSSSETGVDGHGIQPHPPSRPVGPSVTRIPRKRLRVVGGGKEGPPVTARDTKPSNERVILSGTDSGYSGTDSGYRTESQSNLGMQGGSSPRDSEGTGVEGGQSRLTSDEQLAVDVLQEVEVGRPQAEDSLANSSLVSKDSHEDTIDLTDGSANTTMEEEESTIFYSYRSPPKSANSRHPGQQSSPDQKRIGASRGARLDEDFVPGGNEANEQEPTQPTMDVDHQLTETRLSDDYDWRQYASVDLTQSDMSLRARLANPSHSLQQLPITSDTNQSHSSEMASPLDLSGSMTMSSWTERLRGVAASRPFDSLDMRALGGTLSPAVSTMTDQQDLGVQGAWQEGEHELELMYDPQLNCFYDPQTCKYYELVQ